MKIIFANQLRALAAIFVVLNHFWGLFFIPSFLHGIGIPTTFSVIQPDYTKWVFYPPFGSFLPGLFGVGVFFLISGFVIPISLKNQTSLSFLIRRFFRIYPVFLICFIISLFMYFVCSWYWRVDLPWQINPTYILSSLNLMHSAKGLPSIDFVSWSLSVEIKFYILFSIIYAITRKPLHVMNMLLISSLIMLIGAYYSDSSLEQYSFTSLMFSDSQYLSFMFIGCSFYFYLKNGISLINHLSYSMMLIIIWWLICVIYNKTWMPAISINYLYAIILFSLCFYFRSKFKNNVIIDFLADISFPLYLVHSMIGYVLMSIMIDIGFNFILSCISSLLASIFISYFIHKIIEMPSNEIGKLLTIRNKIPYQQI